MIRHRAAPAMRAPPPAADAPPRRQGSIASRNAPISRGPPAATPRRSWPPAPCPDHRATPPTTRPNPGGSDFSSPMKSSTAAIAPVRPAPRAGRSALARSPAFVARNEACQRSPGSSRCAPNASSDGPPAQRVLAPREQRLACKASFGPTQPSAAPRPDAASGACRARRHQPRPRVLPPIERQHAGHEAILGAIPPAARPRRRASPPRRPGPSRRAERSSPRRFRQLIGRRRPRRGTARVPPRPSSWPARRRRVIAGQWRSTNTPRMRCAPRERMGRSTISVLSDLGP
ncbi:hypothetical protein Ddc_21104 [Ditylenchus destructor]|nr:hypothetical protein Ddc_21104 [Ditylenchus destructor]